MNRRPMSRLRAARLERTIVAAITLASFAALAVMTQVSGVSW